MSRDELVAYIKSLGDPMAMDKRPLIMKAFEQIKDTDPERAEVWRKAMSAPEGK